MVELILFASTILFAFLQVCKGNGALAAAPIEGFAFPGLGIEKRLFNQGVAGTHCWFQSAGAEVTKAANGRFIAGEEQKAGKKQEI